MHDEWASLLLDRCRLQSIPFFMKQLSRADTADYKDFDSFPESLRVREWPNAL
jgi:hypothetical protein